MPGSLPEKGGSLFGADSVAISPKLFEHFVYGLAMAERRGGEIVYLNRRARQLLLPSHTGSPPLRCCQLICGHLAPLIGGGCLSLELPAEGGQTPELRMDIGAERRQAAAWVTATPLPGDPSRVLFHLRPGRAGDRRRRTPEAWRGGVCPSERGELQISCLGSLEVEGAEGPLNGEWLEQRPGELFKYLISERGRLLTNEQIGEALWPEANPEESRSRLRYNIHALRERLEPDRPHRAQGRFILARRGGYQLETSGVWIDADSFEREALAGLAARTQGLTDSAASHLATALDLYRGSFLAADPYAEWAAVERERLAELAGRALRAKAEIEIERGELEAAATAARRLVEIEPFDGDSQRLLIEICLRRGRRSEALRRHALHAKRIRDAFGQEPDFAVAELEAGLGAAG